MNLYKKSLYALAGLMLIGTSCTEDYLEIKPQGNLLEVNFYETDQQCFEALIATYDPLTWVYPWGSWYVISETASDEAFAGGGAIDDRPEYQEIDTYTTSPNNAATANLWKKNYRGIYRANLLINNTKVDDAVVKAYQAEAKFLRAYYYFELVRHFGDVPLITTTLTKSEYKQTRKPVAEVYALIESDLKAAIPALKSKKALVGSDKFRASTGAAQALLGKVYLYEKKWAEAAASFAEVVKSAEYQLEPNYADNFLSSHEFGIESVFEISYTNTKPSVDAWGGPNSEGNLDIQLMGPRDLVVPHDTTTIQAGWGFVKPTQTMVDVFGATDVRKDATVFSVAWLNSIGATCAEPYQPTGFFNRKYAAIKGETNALNHDVCYLNNYRIIRYSDVLLMYAEALNESGAADVLGHDVAYYINLVRARAKVANTTATGQAGLRAAIKTERQLELALEGVRYFDLVRWGDASAVLGPLGYKDVTKGLFPIPQGEIEKSQSTLVQNAGY